MTVEEYFSLLPLLKAQIEGLRSDLVVLQEQNLQPVLVDAKEAARILGLESHRSLEPMRADGTGPRYTRIRGKIAYFVDDLREWALKQPTFKNTAEEYAFRKGK